MVDVLRRGGLNNSGQALSERVVEGRNSLALELGLGLVEMERRYRHSDERPLRGRLCSVGKYVEIGTEA